MKQFRIFQETICLAQRPSRQTYIYLLGTEGMRLGNGPKLDSRYGIPTRQDLREILRPVITFRVILASWGSLLLGRIELCAESTDPLLGLAEIGGASIQFAYKDHSERANKTRVSPIQTQRIRRLSVDMGRIWCGHYARKTYCSSSQFQTMQGQSPRSLTIPALPLVNPGNLPRK